MHSLQSKLWQYTQMSTPSAMAARTIAGKSGRFTLRRGFSSARMSPRYSDACQSPYPDQEKSFGIEKVFVNGQLILDGDTLNRDAAAHSGMAMPIGL